MRFVYRSLLVLLVGLFVIAACGQAAPTTVPAVPETDTVSPLPTPTTQAAIQPTAEPTAAALVPQDLTPSPGMGIVRGSLTLGGEVAQGETLYLVPVVATGDSMSVAGLDTNTAPRTDTDSAGDFAFVDVPPGDYALSIVGPVGPVIVPGPNGDEVTVTVEAGQIADLGAIAAPSFY